MGAPFHEQRALLGVPPVRLDRRADHDVDDPLANHQQRALVEDRGAASLPRRPPRLPAPRGARPAERDARHARAKEQGPGVQRGAAPNHQPTGPRGGALRDARPGPALAPLHVQLQRHQPGRDAQGLPRGGVHAVAPLEGYPVQRHGARHQSPNVLLAAWPLVLHEGEEESRVRRERGVLLRAHAVDDLDALRDPQGRRRVQPALLGGREVPAGDLQLPDEPRAELRRRVRVMVERVTG
mmetsp:Transcript_93772/g.286926  ORF Transcript_93772/g.286926 Transcript_93772/m.286926 type:complete len:239 (+) Transcript_93772:817-1533(+)